MAGPVGVNVGSWWKFDRYEVQDGSVRPAQDARLERYDPWEAYREVRATKRTIGKPPYQSLLDLLERITLRPTITLGVHTLSPQSELLLARWCSEYGLLGILPHRTVMATLSPRWESGLDGGPDDLLVTTQHQYVPTPTGWQSIKTVFLLGDSLTLTGEPVRRGDVVAHENRPSKAQEPGVILRALMSPVVEVKGLAEGWSRFFPSVPRAEGESFHYPLPFSEAFWRTYAEPVQDFVQAAQALKETLEALGHMKPLDLASDEELHQLVQGIASLNDLAAPVSAVLWGHEDGSFQQSWLSPSLLSSFAMMALQDLAAKGRVLACAACGVPFIADAYQARYCSSRCRIRAQKRAQRSRKPS